MEARVSSAAGFSEALVLGDLGQTERCIEALASIASKARTDLEKVPALMRVENLKGYSYGLMKETLGDSRNFTREGGSLRIKTAWGYEYEAKYDTYENRFCCSVLHRLIRDLTLLKNRAFSKRPLTRSMRGQVTFEETGSWERLSELAEKAMTTAKESSGFELVDRLLSLSLWLAGKTLFRQLRGLDLSQLEATNQLVEDPDYSRVYRFWVNQDSLDRETERKARDRLTADLLKAGWTEGKDGLTWGDGFVGFALDPADMTLSLGLSGTKEREKAKIGFAASGSLPYLTLSHGSDSVSVALWGVSDYSRIIQALGLVLPYDKGVCPLCGGRIEGESGTCTRCLAESVLFERDGRGYAWIRNILSIKLGGVSDD